MNGNALFSHVDETLWCMHYLVMLYIMRFMWLMHYLLFSHVNEF